MLRFIQRPETDPYYNLAAEEYIFNTAQEDTMMIWRNEPSVIIGKHQNLTKEINAVFAGMHQLPVIRRITGGGAVYHDLGNINFSFIFTNREENLIDFREFTLPVILFLQTLGIKATFEGKNNLTVNGFKISGNSAHLHKNKVLFHGTLLFNTDLDVLEQAVSGREKLFNDKAVGSVRAKVANIQPMLEHKISIGEFGLSFKEFMLKYFIGLDDKILNEDDQVSIIKLSEEKYKSFTWNYGYSPDYEFHNTWKFKEDEYSVSLQVKNGMIRNVNISGAGSRLSFLKKLEAILTGNFHERKSLKNLLENHPFYSSEDSDLMNQLLNNLF